MPGDEQLQISPPPLLGGSTVVWGGLLDPYRTLIASLEVLYVTRFGSKQLIMVQLANMYRKGITDPFVDLFGPPWGLQNVHLGANRSILRPQLVTNLAF